jgi:hypothetical protein
MNIVLSSVIPPLSPASHWSVGTGNHEAKLTRHSTFKLAQLSLSLMNTDLILIRHHYVWNVSLLSFEK